MTAKAGTMRSRTLLLVGILLSGCVAGQAPPQQPRKSISQYYEEAEVRHYAGVEKWKKGVDETTKCFQLSKTNPGGVRPCLDKLPPPETFLPSDRRGNESLSEYWERKNDEWAERSCFFKGLIEARYSGEAQRIEDQCKRHRR